MTRISQYLVWIIVMTSSGRTQRRGYSNSYLQNPRSIIFPDTISFEDYEYPRNRQTESHIHSDLEDPRRQRIQNRVSELRTENGLTSRTQLNKRGGHRKHYLTKLLLELFAALGALEAEASSAVVFPGPSSKSRFEPEISEECRKLGYCKKIPNYPKDQVKQILGTLGNDIKQRFQMDELDTNDVQIAQRFGSEGFSFGLCNSTEEIIVPDSLPDKDGVWWTILQDRENNMTQGFRAENCNQRDVGCNSLVTFPPGYTHKCEQKYVFRTVLVVENNKPIAQKFLRLPSCCSCTITVPSF